MPFIIASRHSAFGKLYLGRGCPVKSKSAALKFSSQESAKERIEWWQRQVESCNLDPKFFNNMYVEEIQGKCKHCGTPTYQRFCGPACEKEHNDEYLADAAYEMGLPQEESPTGQP